MTGTHHAETGRAAALHRLQPIVANSLTEAHTESSMNEELRDVLNQELAKFAGRIMHHVDSKVDELRHELKADVAHVNQGIDALAQRLTDDEAERAAITAQLNRHERWHHRAADALRLKLDY